MHIQTRSTMQRWPDEQCSNNAEKLHLGDCSIKIF